MQTRNSQTVEETYWFFAIPNSLDDESRHIHISLNDKQKTLYSKIVFAHSEVNSKKMSTQEFLASCDGVIDQFNKVIASEDNFYILEKFYLLKVLLRLKNVAELIRKGMTVLKACEPYAYDPSSKKYRSITLFEEVEMKLEGEFFLRASEFLQAKLEQLDSFYLPDIFAYLVKQGPDPKIFSELLLYALKKKGNSINKYLSDMMNFKKHLAEGKLFGVIRAIFDNKELLNKLSNHPNYSIDQLFDSTDKEPKLGTALLTNMDIVRVLCEKRHPSFNFLKFARKLLIDTTTIEDAKKREIFATSPFFDILLLQGFDFSPVIKTIADTFSESRSEARSVFYEALLRGDQQTAENIANASVSYEITRKQSKKKINNGLFDVRSNFEIREKDVHETVQYADSLDYNFQSLMEYMQKKYDLADNPADLYFIHYVSQFAELLHRLKLIQNISEFKQAMSQRFNLALEIEVTTSHDAGLEARIHTLENENKTLTAKVATLEKDLDVLKKQMCDLLELLQEKRPEPTTRLMFS